MRSRNEVECHAAGLEAPALQIEEVPGEVVAGNAVAPERAKGALSDLVSVGRRQGECGSFDTRHWSPAMVKSFTRIVGESHRFGEASGYNADVFRANSACLVLGSYVGRAR